MIYRTEFLVKCLTFSTIIIHRILILNKVWRHYNRTNHNLFICNKHEQFNNLQFEAQRNQIRMTLRMTFSNQSDTKYTNDLYLQSLQGVNVGNIGHSVQSLKKQRSFAHVKVIVSF